MANQINAGNPDERDKQNPENNSPEQTRKIEQGQNIDPQAEGSSKPVSADKQS
ncbi:MULTISPECIES: hypothetical protein [Paenibacillus]|uniref:hypothetical protein n=1 Tax=Paenibacillus TaxID=44249 RepID=UPI00039011BB|nr:MULTISPECIES: hypothetical protein [Paenibacillus]CDN41608.1 hypothetical protein BN871_AI_01190 [Paenibacillus sp. P22]